VQWHPERMQEKERNPLSQKIKEQFIKAIKESKK
jgi:putative glutamine amidotransferase